MYVLSPHCVLKERLTHFSKVQQGSITTAAIVPSVYTITSLVTITQTVADSKETIEHAEEIPREGVQKSDMEQTLNTAIDDV